MDTASEIVEIAKQTERIGQEIIHSKPVVYTEMFLEKADTLAFSKHPYGRYAAGAFGGLFIEAVIRGRL